MNKLIFSFILSLFLISPVIAQELLPKLEVTGTVVVHSKSKLPNSAIVDDKIWWEGTTYVVKDGKLLFPIVLSKNVKLKPGEETMKLVKVETGKITLEFRGKKIVRLIKKRPKSD